MSTLYDRVAADIRTAGRECRLLGTEPSLCFEVDNKYTVYRSLIGHWEVEDNDTNATLGEFITNFDYYIAKATLKLINSYEEKK